MRRLICLVVAVVLCLSAAVVPVMAEPRTVKLSPQKFMVNGQNVDCEKYNIDGSNYFKLRDLAFVLSGTLKQFSVGWDAASRTVSIETGKAYTPEGGELTPGNGMPQTAVVSTQTIMIDGVKVSDMSVYNIGGNNYFKLRDLASKIGFTVDYDEASNTAIVMSEDSGNTAEPEPEEAAGKNQAYGEEQRARDIEIVKKAAAELDTIWLAYEAGDKDHILDYQMVDNSTSWCTVAFLLNEGIVVSATYYIIDDSGDNVIKLVDEYYTTCDVAISVLRELAESCY